MADQKKFQYDIIFTSKAERSGSRNTVDDMKAVETAVKKTSAATATLATNSGQVSEFLNRTKSSAKVSETAFYDLDKALRLMEAPIENLAGGGAAGGAAPKGAKGGGGGGGGKVGKLGAVFQQAGYQVQDFAVQVAGGGSALMALGQQAPQFLGVFGPTGAIAGAAVSVAALIGGIFLKTRKEMGETIDLVADFQEIAKNAAQNNVDNLEKDAAKRKRQLEESKIQDTPDEAGRAAEAAANELRADSLQVLIQATQTLNELMGRYVAAVDEIAAGERDRAAERERQAQREIAAEEKKVADAKSLVATKVQERDVAMQIQSNTEIELAKQRELLGTLRQKRDEMEKLAKQTPASIAGPAGPEALAAMAEANKPIYDARKTLGSQEFKSSLQVAEQTVAALEQRAESLGDSLGNLELSIMEADKKYQEQIGAAKVRIESIAERSGVLAVADAAETATVTQTAIVDKIKEAINEVETSGKDLNQWQTAAVVSLKTIISDGVVTRDELTKAGNDLQQVIGTWKGDNSRIIWIVETIKDLAWQQSTRLTNLERDVRNLQSKQGTPGAFK